jgi:Flp pilus assembly protein CpaB
MGDSAVGRRRRWSSGHLLMLGAGLLGAVATVAVLDAGDDHTAVVVAARDLRVGDRVERDDLSTSEVSSDAELTRELIGAKDLDDLVDLIVTAPIETGSPVLIEHLDAHAAPDGGRAMSFSVPADRAAGGAIDVGDRIDVLAADRDGSVAYALADALVIDVSDGDDGAPLDSGDARDITMTVAVDAPGALRLAGAVAAGDVTVVRATGATALDAIDWIDTDAPERADA